MITGLGLAFLAGSAGAVQTTVFPVLNLGQSARAQAMGEAFTGAADDLSSLFYNPAGLALLQRESLGLNHTSYLSDGFFENGSAAFPFAALGTLAFQGGYLNYGSFDQRDSSGNLTGSINPLEYSVGGGWGFPISGNVFGGVRTQWVQQNVAGNSASALLWDFGFLFVPNSFFRAGWSLKNLGVESTGDNLPVLLRLGTAFRVPLDNKNENRLLLDMDPVVPFQGAAGLRTGIEYANENKFFIRMGYASDFQTEGPGTLNGLNAGAGLFLDPIEVDYSFSFLGDLGNTQQISLVFVLGTAAREQTNPVKPLSEGNGPGSAPLVNQVPANPVILKFRVKGSEDLSAPDLVNQGDAKEKAGLVMEALDLYTRATQKDPAYKPGWSHLGRLSYQKAIESYQNYLKLEPSNTTLKDWLNQNQ